GVSTFCVLILLLPPISDCLTASTQLAVVFLAATELALGLVPRGTQRAARRPPPLRQSHQVEVPAQAAPSALPGQGHQRHSSSPSRPSATRRPMGSVVAVPRAPATAKGQGTKPGYPCRSQCEGPTYPSTKGPEVPPRCGDWISDKRRQRTPSTWLTASLAHLRAPSAQVRSALFDRAHRLSQGTPKDSIRWDPLPPATHLCFRR